MFVTPTNALSLLVVTSLSTGVPTTWGHVAGVSEGPKVSWGHPRVCTMPGTRSSGLWSAEGQDMVQMDTVGRRGLEGGSTPMCARPLPPACGPLSAAPWTRPPAHSPLDVAP